MRLLAAFADGPGGGNPAGVVLDAAALSDAEMLAIAARIGAAETAFVVDEESGPIPTIRVRYFSPVAEVPFCGHATVATAVVLTERDGPGPLAFQTAAGVLAVRTRQEQGGIVASFTSVEPVVSAVDDAVLERLLSLIGVSEDALSEDHPPRLSFAGNVHPIIVLGSTDVFDEFTFEPSVMRALMVEQSWLGTVTILHPIAHHEFEARNLFPVGAMDEDPATGSAAASVGAYLRDLGLVIAPCEVLIRQGRHVGRPSVLRVGIPEAGGITVTGGAVPIG